MMKPFLYKIKRYILELTTCVNVAVLLHLHTLSELLLSQIPQYQDIDPYDQQPVCDEQRDTVSRIYENDSATAVIYSRYSSISEYTRALRHGIFCLTTYREFASPPNRAPVGILYFFTTPSGNLFIDPLRPWGLFVHHVQILEALHNQLKEKGLENADEVTQTNAVRTSIMLDDALVIIRNITMKEL